MTTRYSRNNSPNAPIDELDRYGYTIIRNAIKRPALKLQQVRNDPRAHSKIMWRIRYEVKKHFAKIWNTNDLVSCFGGNNIDDTDFSLDWHVDQNRTHKRGRQCVQGVLAFTPSNATQLLEGSHKHFEALSYRCTSNNPYEWESDAIPGTDCIWKKGLKIVVPELKAGDLLLFDSRMVHRVETVKKRSVMYVSMVPRSFLSNLIQRLRVKAFKNNIITTHWCEKLITTGQDFPLQHMKNVYSLV